MRLSSLLIVGILGLGLAACRVQTTAVPQPRPLPALVNTHTDKIRVDEPKSNALVSSPLTVTGEARGPWYFEASFPVILLDANGTFLAQTPAQAQGEWMTTDFVPFEVTLTFSAPQTATGILRLEKDNPSGLPQYEDSIKIPVRFQ